MKEGNLTNTSGLKDDGNDVAYAHTRTRARAHTHAQVYLARNFDV